MKAIVLTHDDYQCISEHMLFCYNKLWPENPFLFRIPFQDVKYRNNNIYNNKAEFVNTPKKIHSTIHFLLKDIDDEEMIYWCMDDRYPIMLNIATISDMYNWVLQNCAMIDGLSFTLSEKDYSVKYSHIYTKSIRGPSDLKLFKKKHYGSIWSHQFIKAKVLRSFFNNMPAEIKKAKEMDDYLLNKSVLPQHYNLYVSSKSFATFGESTSRGKITKNCYESIVNYQLSIPPNFKQTDIRIIKNVEQKLKYKLIWRLKDIAKNYKYLF